MRDNINIVVVVDSIDIDDSSGSKANVALIKNLRAIGCNISVYHYSRNDIKLNDIDCYSIKERKWNLLYLFSRIQRVLQRNLRFNLSKYFERFFGFSFTFFNDVKSIEKFLNENLLNSPDLILTLSKGGSFRPHYAILQLPELYDKWVAYLHDPYPFHFYPRPYNWIEPGFKHKESFMKKVSERARFSGFPSQMLKEWMGAYFPNFLKTGIIIPHQILKVEDLVKEIPRIINPNKFNVLHAGNLMKQRSPKGLIEGFILFLKKNQNAKKDAKLLLIGNANCHKDVLNKFVESIPELFVINSNRSFEEVNRLQNLVSVNVILESKSEISPFLPGKFPHCVLANKPILLLGPYYSESKRLLGENYEYYSEIDDVDKIALIFEKLYSEWLKDRNNFRLNRKDLEKYVSVSFLKDVFSNLN